MPAVQVIHHRVRALRDLLVAEGLGGRAISRPDFDKMLIQGYGVGFASARLYVRTGEALGLWEVRPNVGPRSGAIILRLDHGASQRHDSVPIHT